MKNLVICPEFTNHCNFKCIKCPQSLYKKISIGRNSFYREKGYMPENLFNIVLKNVKKYAKEVSIGFFGEQMLHPKFNEFIKSLAYNKKYELTINTNLSLVTNKNIEILKLFDEVRINLDSSYSLLYNRTCPGTVLDINGNINHNRLETISKKLEYWLSLPDHSPTRIVYTVSSFNEHDKNQFVKLWLPKLTNKDYILMKSIISYGGIIYNLNIKNNICKIPQRLYFVISWNGDCTPCNLDVNLALKVGNLNKEKDIMLIIRSYKWKNIISHIKNKDGICLNCPDANNWTKNKQFKGKNLC